MQVEEIPLLKSVKCAFEFSLHELLKVNTKEWGWKRLYTKEIKLLEYYMGCI
jgi:hypothetical protein